MLFLLLGGWSQSCVERFSWPWLPRPVVVWFHVWLMGMGSNIPGMLMLPFSFLLCTDFRFPLGFQFCCHLSSISWQCFREQMFPLLSSFCVRLWLPGHVISYWQPWMINSGVVLYFFFFKLHLMLSHLMRTSLRGLGFLFVYFTDEEAEALSGRQCL